jgi:hypothetical protein
MPRVTDTNILFSGSEPKFNIELTSTQITKSLSWYAQNKDKKDALKYGCDYFKKNFKLDASNILKEKVPTFGFICRLVTNGATLSPDHQSWFDSEIEKIKQQIVDYKPKKSPIVEKTNVISIQDRILEKANECIAELEGQVDDLIISAFTSSVSPFGVFHQMNIKDAQTKYILDWAKEKRKEMTLVIDGSDAQLKEGYSNFKKTEIKKIIAYFDQVILDCGKITQTATQSRKPRKRKIKSPDELISKMKFMVEFPELKLKSITATDVVGAMSLWVYNTKTRKLGVYHAEDAGGLSVKGSTLLNFSESKSIQKKLRKPEDTLPQVLCAGKVVLRNILSDVRAVESVLTGRINDDTILLRVAK